MLGITGITARMVEIQTRVATLNPAAQAPVTTAAPSSGTPFASALAQAMATQSGAAPAAGGAAVNADGIPVDLAAYGNGRIPAGALSPIGSSSHHRLWAPAAQSFNAMIEAARRDGVHIGITDSYRSYAEQVDLAHRKGLYSNGGLAAKPGTSEHGWGMAVDLDLNGRAQAWMRANAGRYGFQEDTPREPWHWGFKPG